MELETPKPKKNTGLLPQFENPLATSAIDKETSADRYRMKTDFIGTRKALRRLLDQAKAISKDQLVQETADLLQARLNVDFLWIAGINESTRRLHILGGRGKSGATFKGPFLLLKNSPFEHVLSGNCLAFPRNALVTFPNNPYMLRYNINGMVVFPITVKGKVVGLIAAMNATTIHHAEEICKLFAEAAPEVSDLVFA